ncbi:EthD family reductase [Sphingomonadaceae bacterium OTU29LAMAA1]|nr:EthD family reductase [Sphingomonadaceae bacterium OTU29LAMAA1]
MAQAIMMVTCSGGSFFYRDHYVDVHLPLALECWRRYGLESASAFFPRETDARDVSIGIYRFRDEAAIHAALASPETATVMADVPCFTDASVSRVIGSPA